MLGHLAGSQIGMVGGIIGTVIGCVGGAIGTCCSIKNTKSPLERKFMIKVSVWTWFPLILYINKGKLKAEPWRAPSHTPLPVHILACSGVETPANAPRFS
jgi:hypothetical protein